MILVIRRCLILLLLVLQGFAPLVHAHVHIVGGEEGVHIHGITTVTSHALQFSSLDNYACSNAAIGMHSAIQKKKSLDVALDTDTYIVSYAELSHSLAILEKYIGFPSTGLALKQPAFLSGSAPRAPPL